MVGTELWESRSVWSGTTVLDESCTEVHGASVARAPKILPIKRYVIEIMT
jgi:cytochrome c5